MIFSADDAHSSLNTEEEEEELAYGLVFGLQFHFQAQGLAKLVLVLENTKLGVPGTLIKKDLAVI